MLLTIYEFHKIYSYVFLNILCVLSTVYDYTTLCIICNLKYIKIRLPDVFHPTVLSVSA